MCPPQPPSGPPSLPFQLLFAQSAALISRGAGPAADWWMEDGIGRGGSGINVPTSGSSGAAAADGDTGAPSPPSRRLAKGCPVPSGEVVCVEGTGVEAVLVSEAAEASGAVQWLQVGPGADAREGGVERVPARASAPIARGQGYGRLRPRASAQTVGKNCTNRLLEFMQVWFKFSIKFKCFGFA
jgi:hypothetical protein